VKPHRRQSARLIGLLVTGAICLVVLHRLGTAVPGPSSWSGRDLASWATERNPVVVALAVLRLAALGFGYQLVAVSGLAAVGSLAHAPALLRVSDLVALPGVRGLVRRAAAATLSASTLLAGPVLSVRPAASGSATLRVVGGGSTVTLVVDAPGQATLTVEAPDAAPTTDLAPVDPVGVAPLDRSWSPGAVPSVWTVVRGDHVWSIAERTLAEQWHRPPTELEVDRYWRAVLAANADLADPDLIFVGQLIVLPPVPPP
jgi:hypothetical protein